MASPRPPIEDSEGRVVRGRVMAPPSLTATSTDRSRSAHATSTRAPGSGLACRMALVSSSLTTSVASPTAWLTMPAPCRSVPIWLRAAITLASECGRRPTLDALTSRDSPHPARLDARAQSDRTPLGYPLPPRPENRQPLRYRASLWEPPVAMRRRDAAIPVAWGGSRRVTGTGTGPLTWLDEVT